MTVVRESVTDGAGAAARQANTAKVEYRNSGMFHLEGGWPKDIDYTEVEHTIRYRKKVEKDEDYIAAIAQLGGQVGGRVYKRGGYTCRVMASPASRCVQRGETEKQLVLPAVVQLHQALQVPDLRRRTSTSPRVTQLFSPAVGSRKHGG
jgi:hypothetical protein